MKSNVWNPTTHPFLADVADLEMNYDQICPNGAETQVMVALSYQIKKDRVVKTKTNCFGEFVTSRCYSLLILKTVSVCKINIGLPSVLFFTVLVWNIKIIALTINVSTFRQAILQRLRNHNQICWCDINRSVKCSTFY